MRNLVLTFWLVLVAPAYAGYSAHYKDPRPGPDVALAMKFRESQTLEKLAELLSRIVSVDRNIPIVAASCGKANAFYSPDKKFIVLCYELLTSNANRLSKLGSRMSADQLSEIWLSELVFVLLHEAGHSVFDVFGLPVLGREEDAADQFAAFVLLSSNANKWLKQATLFFSLSKTSWVQKLLDAPALYGDEHSLNEQRTANLVCWGYGKSPEDFAQLAAYNQLPASRLRRCADEFAKLNRDIRGLLGDRLTLDQLNQAVSSAPAESEGSQLAQQYQCMGCHQLDSRRVGPSFREVAQRYRGANVEYLLGRKVKFGGLGVWGQVPAPPNTHVPDRDIAVMVQWILAL